MQDTLIGGQIIYPILKENWVLDSHLEQSVLELIDKINSNSNGKVYVSIRLGGYLVLAGDKAGLDQLKKNLPPKDNYPFQLINHAAFHTPLMEEVSQRASHDLNSLQFKKPKIPLVDGRGAIWQPYSCNIKDIFQYTLGHQVTETYDFSKAISVALKEFAPDHMVLLGPGNSLGGAIGQILIDNRWLGLTDKNSFSHLQKEKPFLFSMGISEQREKVSRIVSLV